MTTKTWLKQGLITFGLMTAALVLFSSLNVAFAVDPSDCPPELLERGGCESSIKTIFVTLLNFVLGFVGIAAVGFVIYGGILYLTSAGKDEQIGTAKKILTYSIVGLIIILIAWALVSTVFDAATGTQQ